MADAKTPCCGEPVVVDGQPCIAWSVWDRSVKCMRCGAAYSPAGDELPAPETLARVRNEPQPDAPPRIGDLEEGQATWVECRGVLLHEESGKMWVDPRFTTTREPIMDNGFPGLCSVLVQRVDGKLRAVEGVKDHTTLVPSERSAGVARPLEWLAD